MSNTKRSLTAISAALGLAIALQSGAATAQAVSADALKGTQFASPEYRQYSWGLEQVSFDAPPVQYSWAEIRARLAQSNATQAVVQVDARPVSADALRGTEFDSPEYVRHSWGLEQVSYDAPAVKLSWSEVNARLAHVTAKSKPAAQANLLPIPPADLRGTQFDAPEYVRHSWGLEYMPYDAPAVRLNWADVKRRLDDVAAGSSSANAAG
jgi:hypothetical protein